MYFTELNKIVTANRFKGIPNALDYVPYSKLFYRAIETRVYEEFGKSATLIDATRVMNSFGNVAYFQWFPDIFKTTKDELKQFYQPKFKLAAQNAFTDYLHGLSHIRSRSEHTFLGEAILIPDNQYFNRVSYNTLSKTNKDISIEKSLKTLYEEFELGEQKFLDPSLLKAHIIYNTYFFQQKENTHYKIYKKHLFKHDIPSIRVSTNFLVSPVNAFEQRLAYNTVRAIYMGMKFTQLNSSGKSFIHTSPAASSREPCGLIFSTEIEDAWMDKISSILTQDNRKSKFQSIINTTFVKNSQAQKIAVKTIKELYELKLI